MDHLKTGIGLRGYGQKDPRVEYEKEAFEIFESLKNNIAEEAIQGVFRVVIEQGPPPQELTPYAPGGPQFEPIPSGQMIPQPVAAGRVPEQEVEQLLGPHPAPAVACSSCTRTKTTRNRRNRFSAINPKLGETKCVRAAAAKSSNAATALRRKGIGVIDFKTRHPAGRAATLSQAAAIQTAALLISAIAKLLDCEAAARRGCRAARFATLQGARPIGAMLRGANAWRCAAAVRSGGR